MSDLLRPLLDAIDTVRERIKSARTSTGWNEAQTRASLIDPVLRALGWDVSNPELVEHESSHPDDGRADYVLRAGKDRLAAIVEAKPLGHKLQGKEITQTTTYANTRGAPYAALTDGNRWVFYDIFKPAAIADSQVFDISLSDNPPQAAALALLACWRPNVSAQSDWRQAEGPRLPTPFPDAPLPAPPPPGADWIPLPEFRPEPFIKPHGPARLPDGVELPLKNWKDLLIGVTRWLIHNHALSPKVLPIPTGTAAKRHLLTTEPRHKSGKEMKKPVQVNPGIWLETHFSQADILGHTTRVMMHCGRDPKTISLRGKP